MAKSKIEGVERLNKKLLSQKKKHGSNNVEIVVGYTQKYSFAVHENIEMKGKGFTRRPPSKGTYWEVGQAKFLEQPAREFAKKIGKNVRIVVKKGGTLIQALLIGGLFLQRESQKLVPLDTGALKASAFTKREK